MDLSPQENYINWATAICWQNLVPTSMDRGLTRGQRGGSPMVITFDCLVNMCHAIIGCPIKCGNAPVTTPMFSLECRSLPSWLWDHDAEAFCDLESLQEELWFRTWQYLSLSTIHDHLVQYCAIHLLMKCRKTEQQTNKVVYFNCCAKQKYTAVGEMIWDWETATGHSCAISSTLSKTHGNAKLLPRHCSMACPQVRDQRDGLQIWSTSIMTPHCKYIACSKIAYGAPDMLGSCEHDESEAGHFFTEIMLPSFSRGILLHVVS
jgi:hypothetical protein